MEMMFGMNLLKANDYYSTGNNAVYVIGTVTNFKRTTTNQ